MPSCLKQHCMEAFCHDDSEETSKNLVEMEENEEDISVDLNDFDICKAKLPETDEGKCSVSLDPQGKAYLTWLLTVTAAFVYNCWVIPLRLAFNYQSSANLHKWMLFDYIADFIYLMDLAFFKPRVMYLEEGFWIKTNKLTRDKYFQKLDFKMDIIALTPTDVLTIIYGSKYLALFRLPRLLKIQTFWELCNKCDNVVASPYVVRIGRTLTYMLYLIHLNACAYYVSSVWEGLGSNAWVLQDNKNAYIRSFYFATKTATSIGKNPKPGNEFEYMYMTWSWLMGVFVFALLIGQIRDIISTATRHQTEYRKLVDETLEYMRRLNLPDHLQKKVKLWFKFTWEQQHTFNEAHILDTLPPKMKTDVAINVHMNSLSKVQIFHECDPALLRELVLKLQPVLYLPGDYICKKGEIGRQIYIIKWGVVEVLGDDETEVLATLTEGSVFGEISLLSMGNGRRRIASVRSRGFSNLFVLSKSDLNEALVNYPEAQLMLKNKAEMLMKENAEREKMNELKYQGGNDGNTEEETDDSLGEEEEEAKEGQEKERKTGAKEEEVIDDDDDDDDDDDEEETEESPSAEETEDSSSEQDEMPYSKEFSSLKNLLSKSNTCSSEMLTTTTWLTDLDMLVSAANQLPKTEAKATTSGSAQKEKNNTFQCDVTVHTTEKD